MTDQSLPAVNTWSPSLSAFWEVSGRDLLHLWDQCLETGSDFLPLCRLYNLSIQNGIFNRLSKGKTGLGEFLISLERDISELTYVRWNHCVLCKIKIPSDSASLQESFPVEMPQDPTTQNPGDAINWNLARSWFAARDRLWVNTVIIIGNWKVHWIDDGSAQHNSIEKAIYQRLVTNDKMIRLCCGNGDQEFQKFVFFFV